MTEQLTFDFKPQEIVLHSIDIDPEDLYFGQIAREQRRQANRWALDRFLQKPKRKIRKVR